MSSIPDGGTEISHAARQLDPLAGPLSVCSTTREKPTAVEDPTCHAAVKILSAASETRHSQKQIHIFKNLIMPLVCLNPSSISRDPQDKAKTPQPGI